MIDDKVKGELLDEVARLSIATVAEHLVTILGSKETALIGGATDTRLVQQWIRSERIPQRPEALRAALVAARIVADSNGQTIAQAWFIGCNPHLDLESPTLTLRDSEEPEVFAKVIQAAFEFTHH